MDPPPEPPAASRKFQTRRGVQRTSKADREAFARAEEQRQAEAQREAERAGAAAARGAYTPRGRSALPSKAPERTRNETGGGVFGAAVPALGLGAGRGRSAGRGGAVAGNVGGLIGLKEEVPVEGLGAAGEIASLKGDGQQSNAGAEFGKNSAVDGDRKLMMERKRPAKQTKKDGPVMLSSDEEGLGEDGPRRDIETIEISSDDEEDGVDYGNENEVPGFVSATAAGKRRERQARPPRAKMALRPVRAPREAREANELDGFSSRRKMQRSGRDRDKAQSGEDEFGGAPVEDDDHHAMDIDEGEPLTDFSLRRIDSQIKGRRKKGLSTKDKDLRLASETIEERAERLRHAEDVRKIRHELSAVGPLVATTGDIEMMEPAVIDYEVVNERDGTIYLFQFPPLTPMLIDPTHKDDVMEIKQEPGAEGAKADGEMATTAAPAPQPPTGKEREKEKSQPQIKKEDHDSREDAKTQTAAATERAKILAADGARLPPGLAGNLNIHRSGKVTLEWGETNMEVRWGSEVDFLQDVVLAVGDEGEEVIPGELRNAFALGQVHKKLVVIPDWQKIYE